MLHEIEEFTKNTSVRGPRRIVTRQGRFLKLFWLIFVVVSAGLMSYHLYTAITVYARKDTYFSTSMKSLNKVPFPAISFCVAQRFSRTSHEYFGSGAVESPYNYSRRLRRTLWQNNSDVSTLLYDTFEAYFQNKNLSELRNVTFTASSLRLHCVIFGHDGSQRFVDGYSPLCHMNVTQFWHSSFLSCFRLTVPTSVTHDVASAFIRIHPDTKYSGNPKVLHGLFSDIKSKGNHLVIEIHRPGTYATFTDSTPVNYNTVTNIKVKPILAKLNYEQCSNEIAPKVTGRHDYDCTFHDIARRVMDTCGCIFAKSTVFPRFPTANFCLKIDWHDLAETNRRRRCWLAEMAGVASNRECRLCRELIYRTTIRTVSRVYQKYEACWYHFVLHHLEHATMNSNVTHEVDLASYLRRIVVQFDVDQCDTYLEHAESSTDFVELKVAYAAPFLEVKEEHLRVEFSTLAGQIGAIGSLWLGLTVTFIGEIVDLTISIMSLSLRSRTNKAATVELA